MDGAPGTSLLYFDSHFAGRTADVQVRLDPVQRLAPGRAGSIRAHPASIRSVELAALIGDPETYLAHLDAARHMR